MMALLAIPLMSRSISHICSLFFVFVPPSKMSTKDYNNKHTYAETHFKYLQIDCFPVLNCRKSDRCSITVKEESSCPQAHILIMKWILPEVSQVKHLFSTIQDFGYKYSSVIHFDRTLQLKINCASVECN